MSALQLSPIPASTVHFLLPATFSAWTICLLVPFRLHFQATNYLASLPFTARSPAIRNWMIAFPLRFCYLCPFGTLGNHVVG